MTGKEYRFVVRCHYPDASKETGLTPEEVSILCGIPRELVYKFVELALIEYEGKFDRPTFCRDVVLRIEQIMRLRRDLGINWAGIGLTLDLLEEIQRLEQEIKRLRQW
jgi:hypothetical protein